MGFASLFGMLDASAERWPERVALASEPLALSYRSLRACAEDLTGRLRQLGLSETDTVALAFDSCVEFVVTLFAVSRVGAAAALVDPWLSLPEIVSRASAVHAKAILIPERFASRFDDITTRVWEVPPIASQAPNDPRALVMELGTLSRRPTGFSRPHDAALLMFTAGTTSAPKVVPLGAANVSASVDGICSIYRLSPDDATLVVMPLFHGHGLVAGLLSTLASGGTAHLPRAHRFSAHSFWQEIEAARATWFTAVPTIHQILLARAKAEYPERRPPALRFIRSCSAPLADHVLAELEAAFHAPVISAYGMTETAHQATSNPLPGAGPRKPGSVGIATGVGLRILGADGQPCARGVDGEVCVRGPAVMAGYLDDDAANASSFVDGWFRTGDLGAIDDDGYLFLRGRIKEIINRGGEKISPNAIDSVLLGNPKIEDALSFGVPDEKYGEEVAAAVVLKPGQSATETELADYTRRELGAFEAPKHFYFVADFPRTAKGAGDRRKLAAMFGRSSPK